MLLPATTNVASNALPDSWRSSLWLAWPICILLAIPVLVMELRTRHGMPAGHTPPPVTVVPNGDAQLWNIPAPAKEFSNRRAEFRRIGTILMRGSGRALLLCGMGGVGKTQLALAYAHRQRSSVSLGWWIPAGSRTSAISALAELGRLLNLTSATAESTAKEVVGLLSERAGWLLIFDDARIGEDLLDLVPVTSGGQVLITSRNPQFDRLAETLLLQVFPQEEASRFLRNRAGDTDQDSSAKLAARLGGLPLALEQAGAYCRDSGIGLRDYLQRYDSSRARLLRHGSGLNRVSVEATLELSFDWVARRDTAAIQLLRVLSVMAPTEVPRGLPAMNPSALPRALARACADVVGLDQTIATLLQASLLTSATAEHIRVHQLISDVLRDRITADGNRGLRWLRVLQAKVVPGRDPSSSWSVARWVNAALALLWAGVQVDERHPDGWRRASILLPHAEKVWTYLTNGAATSRDRELVLAAQLFGELGIRLFRSGDYAVAEELCRRAWRIGQGKLSDADPRLLRMTDCLAQVTHGLGNLGEARDLYEQILPVYRRAFGEDHPDTIQTMNNLGGVLMEQEEHLPQARHLYEQVVSTRLRTLGKRDNETLIAMNNLGKACRRLGDLSTAHTLAAETVRLGGELLGEEHPDNLVRMNNLAEVLRARGDLEDARALHQKVLALRREVLGEAHPANLVSMNNLARVMRLLGDTTPALHLYEESLRLARQVVGESHPSFTAAENGVRECLGDQHRMDGGE
ncbi:tetratricopeptide repeat protein [Microbispora sp. NBC_01189]|uniref:tetratricopeptide repeat protein n=1 Tax=Microbispora sp. NBC_01189 TaxID=2903583 RepID=UPI002E12B7E7|nr:tetratricopeptide repeat protein [Microbispora sp. NBC_01189]